MQPRGLEFVKAPSAAPRALVARSEGGAGVVEGPRSHGPRRIRGGAGTRSRRGAGGVGPDGRRYGRGWPRRSCGTIAQRRLLRRAERRRFFRRPPRISRRQGGLRQASCHVGGVTDPGGHPGDQQRPTVAPRDRKLDSPRHRGSSSYGTPAEEAVAAVAVLSSSAFGPRMDHRRGASQIRASKGSQGVVPCRRPSLAVGVTYV
jgi:hypothetical protein